MKGTILKTGGRHEDGRSAEMNRILVDGVTITVPGMDYSLWATENRIPGESVCEVDVPDDIVELARSFAAIQVTLNAKRGEITALIQAALVASKQNEG